VEVYTPVVRAYCFQRRLQESDADDIVQDVMTSISKSIQSFEYNPEKGRFRAWFGTIVANRIKTVIARTSRNNSHICSEHSGERTAGLDLVESNAYADPDSSWVEIFSSRVLRVACQRIRGEFSENAWTCFEETWLNRQQASKISDVLGIPIHTVYVNKSRVLKRLKVEVGLLADDAPFLDNADDKLNSP